MKSIKWTSPAPARVAALLLTLSLAGCGGTGSSGSSSLQTTGGTGSTANTPVGSAVTTLAPGATATSNTSGSTMAAGPSVPYSNPTDKATNVPVSTVEAGNVVVPRTVSATFSEPMNPTTLTSPAVAFSVKETVSGNSVDGTVSMNVDNTVATFTPAAALPGNTQITASVTTAATSTNGTPLANGYEWTFTTGTQVGQGAVNLGTAAGFLVLGGTSIDNVSSAANPTRVNGQFGIDPGNTANVSGFTDSTPQGSGLILTGGIQFGPVVKQAKNDLLTALNDASGRTINQISVDSADLGSFVVNGGTPGVIPPGLYSSVSTLTLTTADLTLDARGDPDAVWVFKAASGLTVGDARQVVLRNGAKAKNVYWTVGSSATLGDQVNFKGNILAKTSNSIGSSMLVGTTVEGRVLSVSGLNLYASAINPPSR